ncbi:ABC transporter G family member 23-like [Mercurialis annua]|uniref:ABC transporter G family member 23-like n=1 Tax=Mercurialis annua TaxID=3986 RepID=UPI00215E5AC6|nr:ABC transporter G family member 23-like [Mercurialis annua]
MKCNTHSRFFMCEHGYFLLKSSQFSSDLLFKEILSVLKPAQEDNLLPLLTVQETLMYSAKFRLRGLSMSSKDREKLVENLMMELKLSHVAHSFVGDEEKRGISGGERKRVSIGVEMIHNPAILILDEPTSGPPTFSYTESSTPSY